MKTKFFKTKFIGVFALIYTYTSLLSAYSLDNKIISSEIKKEYQIIVKFKDYNKKEDVKSSILDKYPKLKINSSKKIKNANIELYEFDYNSNMDQLINEFRRNPYVEYAQPNYKLYTNMLYNEPSFNEQWGMKNTKQVIGGQRGVAGIDINILSAWNITTGNINTIVGVLDTGIDISHSDLKNNIFVNEKEIPANGLDDDNNGYIDDINGWDFSSEDNTVYDSSYYDIHGTHVTGIIAGSSNNDGICGVAPNVRIMPLKFMNGDSGYTSDAIEAIQYAETMGIKIINCSWGGTQYNPALKDVMQNSDILFICAAGNNGLNTSTTPIYPATFNLPNIISVAAIDNTGALYSQSNYGTLIHIAAPGVGILSTMPGNSYSYQSGTSMAAPFVTGVAALLKSNNSVISNVEMANKIKSGATVMNALKGKVSTSGRLNAYSSLIN